MSETALDCAERGRDVADNGREGARPWPSAPHARRVGSYEIFVDIQVDQNRSKLLYNCCSMTYSVMLAVWQCQLKGNKNLHIYIYTVHLSDTFTIIYP